jgi:Flp pilus assembly protein TadG
MKSLHKQKGAETVEFALVAIVFFAVIFTVIEFGRAMFTWNALTEATRRGARLAAVCPVGSSIPIQVALFGPQAGSLTASPVLPGLTSAMVSVTYPANAVQVSIVGYTHTLIIPLWGTTVTAPPFTTTLPRESMGAVPTYTSPSPAPSCSF